LMLPSFYTLLDDFMDLGPEKYREGSIVTSS
jgi:hypothetical protein